MKTDPSLRSTGYGPGELCVADLRAFGLDTARGFEPGEDLVKRGDVVVAHTAGRRTARGLFVGFDDVTRVLWVAWSFDPEESLPLFAWTAACGAFDGQPHMRARAAAAKAVRR